MNQNGDEKTIRQLFREMRLEDQHRAPGFAGVLAAANSRMVHSRNRFHSLRYAIAAAMLCAAVLIAMAIIVNSSKPQGATAHDTQAAIPTVQPAAPPSVIPSDRGEETPGVGPRKTVVKRARNRRPSNQTEIATKSLFAWQSPTASLLQTPHDELLKSLPRLGESLQTIKFFSPDQFN